jgi:hypothetical protein
VDAKTALEGENAAVVQELQRLISSHLEASLCNSVVQIKHQYGGLSIWHHATGPALLMLVHSP